VRVELMHVLPSWRATFIKCRGAAGTTVIHKAMRSDCGGLPTEADEGVGRGPGGPPHQNMAFQFTAPLRAPEAMGLNRPHYSTSSHCSPKKPAVTILPG
jgi:hypothetical protein